MSYLQASDGSRWVQIPFSYSEFSDKNHIPYYRVPKWFNNVKMLYSSTNGFIPLQNDGSEEIPNYAAQQQGYKLKVGSWYATDWWEPNVNDIHLLQVRAYNFAGAGVNRDDWFWFDGYLDHFYFYIQNDSNNYYKNHLNQVPYRYLRDNGSKCNDDPYSRSFTDYTRFEYGDLNIRGGSGCYYINDYHDGIWIYHGSSVSLSNVLMPYLGVSSGYAGTSLYRISFGSGRSEPINNWSRIAYTKNPVEFRMNLRYYLRYKDTSYEFNMDNLIYGQSAES